MGLWNDFVEYVENTEEKTVEELGFSPEE